MWSDGDRSQPIGSRFLSATGEGKMQGKGEDNVEKGDFIWSDLVEEETSERAGPGEEAEEGGEWGEAVLWVKR
jgi:hypothetical protein